MIRDRAGAAGEEDQVSVGIPRPRSPLRAREIPTEDSDHGRRNEPRPWSPDRARGKEAERNFEAVLDYAFKNYSPPRRSSPRRDRIPGAEEDDGYVAQPLPPFNSFKPSPPFPDALKDTRKPTHDKELFETFANCRVNVPLINLIQSVPRFAKFMKELCTIKRKNRTSPKIEKVALVEKTQDSKIETCNPLLQKQLPKKCSDPGRFTVPVTIGETKIERAMLDLGASINVLPACMYDRLGLDPLKESDIVIELVDHSNVRPKGLVEDVLVQVQGLIFLADFYVMEIGEGRYDPVLLLGRPFMKTVNTVIDVANGSLSISHGGNTVRIDVDEDPY